MRRPDKGYRSKHLVSRKTDNGYAITMAGKTRSLVNVVPDEKYPGTMWRVVEEDGSLLDMVNLTRAIDAAMTRAMAILNR